MNILGLSFGKVMGNDDILVKEALFGAKEACPDAEIRFVNTIKMKIGRCIGCGACSMALEKGKDNDCIIKDDFQELEEHVRWADVLIVAAPVYTLQPVGQFKDFVDRFSCRHDISAIPWVLDKRRTGEMPGDPDAFPMERLKRRVVSFISVGGATTKNWVSMGCASMPLFAFSAGMHQVGNMDASATGPMGSPVLNEPFMKQARDMGAHTALSYLKPDEELTWFGPEGTCPCCHQDLLMVNGTTTVECPVCGIEGKLSIVDDKIKVEFSEDQKLRARGTFRGLREHTEEIQGFGAQAVPKIMAAGGFDVLKEKLAKYRNFEEEISKM